MDGYSSSSSASAGEGAALPWILEHLLSYPGSYEIPLRTMYSLNSAAGMESSSSLYPVPSGSAFSRLSDHKNNSENASSVPLHQGRHSPSSSNSSNGSVPDSAARFKAHLMTQIAQLPSQPFSLPPVFIMSFVRKCFSANLEEVDFPQALTALDYLKDLENRRKREVIMAFKRLGITGAEGEREDLSKRYPGVLSWISSIESKEREVIALYTQCYLRIRFWIIINEMLLTPFDRSNCIAMLNTIFPPVIRAMPTPHLNEKIFQNYRMQFFNYIVDVEKLGPRVLDPVIKQGMRQGESTGWPATHDIIENYLQTANDVIKDCSQVNYSHDIQFTSDTDSGRKGRKVDSGVGIFLPDRPSTSGSSSGSSSGYSNSRSFFTKSPPRSPTDFTRDTTSPKKAKSGNGTTLEKIAREIRKLKSRGDLKEVAIRDKDTTSTTKSRSLNLKKMKSAGGLRDGKRTESDRYSSANDDDAAATFDPRKFKKHRQEWEAKNSARLQQLHD